jgi:PRTRC genetic system protein E
MIDFTKLANVVPNNGTLHLILMKSKDGKMTIIYAPKFTGKENDNVLRPLTIKDTPENLTAIFEEHIPDLSAKQRIYADDFKTRAEEIDKALAKKAAGPAKSKASSNSSTSKTQDLLSGTKALDKKTNNTKEEETETGEEAPGSDETASDTPEAAAEAQKAEEDEENLFD